ncbi:hypothetical protein [Pleomorphovibrio marinus]|uniref:hypothetical protein n=1 Tax=Pleomorphovibrio marinus TaxID=2164132 RepID=UPI000E0A6027|nr:hypothetical protein [Pleomorphovibrio marinus]
MTLLIGALIIIGIVIALILIFRKIFNKNPKETTVAQEMSSKEVLKKEVSEFDTDTGDKQEEGTKKEENPVEKSDDNKEIR